MANSGLALACANIGGLQADDEGNERYVKSPDYLESLRDVQRYLRRDNPETRDVFLELGKWNVVRQDLVPLIKRYSDDFEIVLNCVKILVFLTMPVDPISHQVSKQVEYLQHFKAAIVEGDAIAVIVSHLEEPLQNLESGCPKDDDWKLFQLFLTLVRNFLSIPDCLQQHGPSSPHLSNLRDQMLERLFSESAMELVVVLTHHVAGHGGLRQDNLLILEIVQQAFSGQQADLVAAAAHKGVKVAKHSEKSAATLRAVLQSEREQLKRLRKDSSPFTGMFVQVARDGSKTMLTRNPHHSPLENLIRKPQVKRGVIKRIVQDPHPVFHPSDQIYILLNDFADQFLASGYNILMQSVKEDIRRERSGFETPDIVAFFQVAQFFTSYQCYVAQRDQKQQTKLNDSPPDGAEKEAGALKHLCGLIASTMDEAMFSMVMSKWHEFTDSAQETKDWKPVAAAGGAMKDMIRMLDLVLKRSGNLTKEGHQELRTARILLYKVFYDQTENGILQFLNSLIRSFDIYKQPRSHLADLVEITHIVLRILDSFAKSGESLRVLTKVRGGWKKKPKPSELPQTEEAEQDATEASADGKAPKNDTDFSLSPRHMSVSSSNVDPNPERVGDERITENELVANDEACQNDQSEVELEKDNAAISHEDEEDETFHTSAADGAAAAAAAADPDDLDERQQNRTREVTLNTRAAVEKFASNAVVRNYCWLLKFHSTNRAAINHYIVRMLQRICEDCMLEPMLYQISILQTFYSVLSNNQVQAAEDHRFVIGFLSKLVRRLFKKLEAHPILFVDMLFWKTRIECHNISADYMIHSLRKETGGASQNRKRINIADALGDDEEDQPLNLDSDKEGSASSSDDDDAEAPDEISLFSEEHEAQIKGIFERYKDDEQPAQLIASELDPSGKFTAAQVLRKLQRLGLVEPSAKQSKKKVSTGGDNSEKGAQSSPPKLKRRRASDGSTASKKSNLFSEAQDQALRELFERHGSGKNVTKVITENLGEEFTTAQVSRRLRRLGLVKPKPRTARSSLHDNLTESGEDDDHIPTMGTEWEGGNSNGKRRGAKPALKSRINSDDFLDRDGDDDVLASALNGPPSRQDGTRSAARQEEKRLRKRRIDSLDLDSDDDAPVARLVRPAPSEHGTASGDRSGEEEPPTKRTVTVDLEDSEDDDALLSSRPARIEDGGAPGPDHKQEKHPRRRRVTTVNSEGSEDDLPNTKFISPAPREKTVVELEDSDDDVPLNRLSRSAPGHAGTSVLDQTGERNVSRMSENIIEDLEDSEDDVNNHDCQSPGHEGSGGWIASLGGHHRKRKRANTIDLSDSDNEAP